MNFVLRRNLDGLDARERARSLTEIRNLARGAGQLQDVQSGVRAIDDVDVAAVVHFYIVRLDRRLAALVGPRTDTPLIRLRGDRRNVVGNLPRTEGIPHV